MTFMILSCFNVEGIPPSPQIVETTSTATSITLKWDQPVEESVDIECYQIDYQITDYLDECYYLTSYPLYTITLSNISLKMHTIVNSIRTPVEDGSPYEVYLYAVNSFGRSISSILSSFGIRTLETGIYRYMNCKTMITACIGSYSQALILLMLCF